MPAERGGFLQADGGKGIANAFSEMYNVRKGQRKGGEGYFYLLAERKMCFFGLRERSDWAKAVALHSFSGKGEEKSGGSVKFLACRKKDFRGLRSDRRKLGFCPNFSGKDKEKSVGM